MANILGKFKILREKWGGEVQQMIQFLGYTRAWNLNGRIGMMAFSRSPEITRDGPLPFWNQTLLSGANC